MLVDVGDVEIATRVVGSGPPLLLLHGYPQTRRVWQRVADELADRFTVVTTDLRGYGESSKPAGDDAHATYSKRSMAGDQVEVMRRLGFERFAVAGHDRGARVVHRMCLDNPETVAQAALLDILPTSEVYATTDRQLATAYFHWFFLIRPHRLAEQLIDGNPDAWMENVLGLAGGAPTSMSDEDVEHYKSYFRDPAVVHATCEDYRAGASVDLEHDALDVGRRITCPVLVLWGDRGLLARREHPLNVWKRFAHNVTGEPIPGGHFFIDDSPADVVRAVGEFLEPWRCGRLA
ncbi:alpha/beta fold hydrolase [Rhodococcus sp. TAF43]|uniref:alpha/beta fold hydrolase n=1 Tax=Rhodococcus sp. TAF43 TaxID=3237483 RepID=UPI003F9D6D26